MNSLTLSLLLALVVVVGVIAAVVRPARPDAEPWVKGNRPVEPGALATSGDAHEFSVLVGDAAPILAAELPPLRLIATVPAAAPSGLIALQPLATPEDATPPAAPRLMPAPVMRPEIATVRLDARATPDVPPLVLVGAV